MNFFKRLFKIGQAEANAAIDGMEDPIKMTEQGIRDLKLDLEKSIESLAQVKALSIRTNNEIDELATQSKDYQEKAMIILTKAKNGEIDAGEADNLAKQALIKKAEIDTQITSSEENSKKIDGSVTKLEHNVQEIKDTIHKWESELKTLKARVKVSTATKKLNKQMAELDGSETVAMLQRMKDKINQEEALAEAYGDLAKKGEGIDEKLKKYTDSSSQSAEAKLKALKEQLGINKK